LTATMKFAEVGAVRGEQRQAGTRACFGHDQVPGLARRSSLI
jgi:hypothetical protein